MLARVFTMRRFTWTFLSQHAQVVDYDGTRLLLGIATEGLAQTFRQGKHGDWVRQALIDEIGIDVPVEGIPMADAGAASAGGTGRTAPTDASAAARAETGPPRGSGSPVVDRPERDESSTRPSRPSPVPATSAPPSPPSGRPSPRTSAPDPEPDVGPEPPPDDDPPPPEDDGRPMRPAPTRATPARAADRPSTARSRGAAAAAAAATSPQAAGRPDDAVSDEDEDIAASGAAGRQVLERVLGAQVIREIED